MAPAAECKCGFKVKTAHEPPANGEMREIIRKIALHSAIAGANFVSLNPKVAQDGHTPIFEYHERTPEDGSFDGAEQV